MKNFKKTYEVRWADLDPNSHLRHSAYLDYAAQTRFACLEAAGFHWKKFLELQMGPVLFSEKIDYFKEVRAGELITVDFKIAGMSEDGRKWQIRHQIKKADDVKSAEIKVFGAWFHLQTRKVSVPPKELMEFFQNFEQTEDFTTKL